MQRIFARADGLGVDSLGVDRPGADSPGTEKPRSHARVLRPLEPVPVTAASAAGRASRRLLVVLACCGGLALVLFGAFIAYSIEAQKDYTTGRRAAALVAERSSSRPAPAPPPSKAAPTEGEATAYRVVEALPATRPRHVFRRRVAERPGRDPAIAVPLTGEALERALVEDAAVTRRLNQAAMNGTPPTLGYAPGVTEAVPR